jgi:hypothetical protein
LEQVYVRITAWLPVLRGDANGLAVSISNANNGHHKPYNMIKEATLDNGTVR